MRLILNTEGYKKLLKSTYNLLPLGIAYFDCEGTLKAHNSKFSHLIYEITNKHISLSCASIEKDLILNTIIDGPKVTYSNCMSNDFDKDSIDTVTQILHSLRNGREYIKKVVFDRVKEDIGGLIILDMKNSNCHEKSDHRAISTAAHEIRGPLANVYGYIELLLNKRFMLDEQYKILEIVNQEVSRLSAIVDDLLSIEQLNTYEAPSLNYETCDIKTLIQELFYLDGKYLREHKLEIDINNNVRPLMCDPEKIKQVIINLVTNAEKYSQPNSTITLRIRPTIFNDTEGVEISVEDHGIGMHGHEIKKIFNPFYRAVGKYSEHGSGLGLSIVKKIIQLHRGDINVESEYGKGSTFTVKLPRDRRLTHVR